MKQYLKIVFGFMLLQACYAAHALDVSVGRANVQLPQGRWEVIEDANFGLPYGGDASGAINSVKKIMVLLSEKSEVLALVVIGASSGGVTGATMSWNGGCKPNSSQSYHFDVTRGSLNQQDCIKAWSDLNARTMLNRLEPTVEELLKSKNYLLPTKMHLATHFVATNNGSFASTKSFVNLKFSNPKSDTPLPGNVVSNEAFANWTLKFAEATSSSVRSLSGALKMPELTFSDEKSE